MYTDAAGIDQRTISTANGQCRRKSTRLFCLYADVRMADLWTHETALRDGQQAFLAFFAIAGYGPGSAADATADWRQAGGFDACQLRHTFAED